jgi:antitoxin (DNA-binding transcriptional repressor) of toxin-antitoxin stability system
MSKRVIHISEKEASETTVAALVAQVRAGAEVVIESNAQPVAFLRSAEPDRRSISECIALLPEDSTATIDADFARDVQAAVESHSEPLTPPAWE